jgi:hypothetical protein
MSLSPGSSGGRARSRSEAQRLTDDRRTAKGASMKKPPLQPHHRADVLVRLEFDEVEPVSYRS